MERNGGVAEVDSFAVAAATSADAGDVVPSFSVAVHVTFVARSQRSYCSRKLWLMMIIVCSPPPTKVSLGDTLMMLLSPVPFPS